MLLKYPLRSPDMTPCDCFPWGYVKGLVYAPPLPANLEELKQRITTALQTVTQRHAAACLGEAGVLN